MVIVTISIIGIQHQCYSMLNRYWISIRYANRRLVLLTEGLSLRRRRGPGPIAQLKASISLSGGKLKNAYVKLVPLFICLLIISFSCIQC